VPASWIQIWNRFDSICILASASLILCFSGPWRRSMCTKDSIVSYRDSKFKSYNECISENIAFLSWGSYSRGVGLDIRKLPVDCLKSLQCLLRNGLMDKLNFHVIIWSFVINPTTSIGPINCLYDPHMFPTSEEERCPLISELASFLFEHALAFFFACYHLFFVDPHGKLQTRRPVKWLTFLIK